MHASILCIIELSLKLPPSRCPPHQLGMSIIFIKLNVDLASSWPLPVLTQTIPLLESTVALAIRLCESNTIHPHSGQGLGYLAVFVKGTLLFHIFISTTLLFQEALAQGDKRLLFILNTVWNPHLKTLAWPILNHYIIIHYPVLIKPANSKTYLKPNSKKPHETA